VPNILCPYDLCRIEQEDLSEVVCPELLRPLPRLYLTHGLHAPTDIVTCIGRTGNGKTTLLMSMLGTLIDRPDHLGSHAAVGTYAAADETFDDNSSAIAWARQAYGDFLAHGILPKGTPTERQPVPFYILGCPPDGRRRNLFLFDNGGEAFRDIHLMTEFAYPTAQARVVWIVASLDREGVVERDEDAQHGALGSNLWGLLDAYAGAREEIRHQKNLPPYSPQALLVIFTKADARGHLFPELESALERETLMSTQEERHADSNLMREALLGSATGALRRAESDFDRVEFCVVSATGGAVAGQWETLVPNPRLVLNPLAWTWELTDWLDHNDAHLRRRHRRGNRKSIFGLGSSVLRNGR
jgi:energy-coupling factor transporter ATP-binding protein EcfA2